MSIALLSTSNYSCFTFPYPSYHFICFSYILRFATTSLGWIIFQLLFTRITVLFFLPSSLSRNTNHCFLPEPTAFCNLHLGYLCLCGESFKLISASCDVLRIEFFNTVGGISRCGNSFRRSMRASGVPARWSEGVVGARKRRKNRSGAHSGGACRRQGQTLVFSPDDTRHAAHCAIRP